jgi:hypothetical protein
VPFLRLTRDRRGFENTFLMHADRPGDRPRLLYWYRTAPGIVQGRSPLDEDAIRTIEEQHPDIDFDWPAILALAEVMTPEEEAPARSPQQQRQGRKQRGRDQRPQPSQQSAPAREQPEEPRRDDRAEEPSDAVDLPVNEAAAAEEAASEAEPSSSIEIPPPRNLLVEELAGREIGARLRARYAEIIGRIQDLDVDGSIKDTWFKRAEAIDPELWMTPEAVLEGVRSADAQYDQLRSELAG